MISCGSHTSGLHCTTEFCTPCKSIDRNPPENFTAGKQGHTWMLLLVPCACNDHREQNWRGTDLWLLYEGRIEELQLCADGIVVPNGVWGGAVDHMHQHLAALRVAQELVPQPNARMGALQQTCMPCQEKSTDNSIAVRTPLPHQRTQRECTLSQRPVQETCHLRSLAHE